ncbi:MAG: hypothetical protein ACRD4V_07220 [Candidatus Acidiferrales bacterium]
MSLDPIHRRLLGESLREIGVLVFVFFPLDILLESKAYAAIYPQFFWLRWVSMQHWVTIFFAGSGIALLYFGIKIDAKTILEEGGDHDDLPDAGI